jgi:hypothetical protein
MTEITAKQTRLVPRNKPKRYRNPCRQPYAAPNPANDNTPGPGVIIKRKTARVNVSIY